MCDTVHAMGRGLEGAPGSDPGGPAVAGSSGVFFDILNREPEGSRPKSKDWGGTAASTDFAD